MSLAFPNVPALPGVPQLVRQLGSPISSFLGGLPIIGQILAQASQASNIWGVFSQPDTTSTTAADGTVSVSTPDPALVVQPDSIRDFSMRAEWRVSNFPVQQGSFTSYNKVTLPAEYAVQMVKGGTVDDRATFESQIDAIAGSTDLYTIVTPERSYPNSNVTRYEITRRGVSNAFFVVVDLFFIQIIEQDAAYSITSNAQTPGALPNVSLGTITPQAVGQQVSGLLSSVGVF